MHACMRTCLVWIRNVVYRFRGRRPVKLRLGGVDSRRPPSVHAPRWNGGARTRLFGLNPFQICVAPHLPPSPWPWSQGSAVKTRRYTAAPDMFQALHTAGTTYPMPPFSRTLRLNDLSAYKSTVDVLKTRRYTRIDPTTGLGASVGAFGAAGARPPGSPVGQSA